MGRASRLPILVVDDEAQTRDSLCRMLASRGWEAVDAVGDGEKALAYIDGRETGAVILDLNMPGIGGLEVLRLCVERHPEVPVIVVTGSADIDRAVECMKRGAYDFFTKPARADALDQAARRAMEKRENELEIKALGSSILSPRLETAEAFSEIVTNSPSMIRLFRYIEAIAKSPEPLLIQGESGTGQELLARALYAASGLRGDFVPVNLAGLDDAFFSDSLFGHRKGAFTGADGARAGLVEKARDGLIFLDEIGDLKPESQVKLLRLLQEGEYYKLGSDLPVKARVRVCAATHRDLHAMVEEGSFRLDLYYRLASHRLTIPSLRERPEDIPLLAVHFLAEAGTRLGQSPAVLNDEALGLLLAYDFPGNARELRSLMYDASCAQEGGAIPAAFLAQRLNEASSLGGAALGETRVAPARDDEPIVFPGKLPNLKEVTRLLVAEALRRSRGNQARAAALLGISHQALSKRLKNERDSGPEPN